MSCNIGVHTKAEATLKVKERAIQKLVFHINNQL